MELKTELQTRKDILGVGFSNVKHKLSGVTCGSVSFVGELILVQPGGDAGLDISQHQPFKTFHDYRCEGNGPVIISGSDC